MSLAVDTARGIELAFIARMTDFITLDDDALACSRGGQQAQNQEQLRALARQYCPRTYQQYRRQPITRPIAERCLDEAGYGEYRQMLDAYFPRRP